MYIRKRLNFLKEFWQSKKFLATIKKLSIDWKVAQNWLNDFKKGGLDEVCKPIKRKLKQKLSPQNKQKLKKINLTKTPQDYDIDRYIWTGWILEKVIYKEF